MKPFGVPKEIMISDALTKEYSLSPAMYKKVNFGTDNLICIEDMLDPTKPYVKGIDPGSASYIKTSNFKLLRTKVLQQHSCLIYPKGDCVVSINPKSYVNLGLIDYDILMSKDSNIGEVAIFFQHELNKYMFSGGIIKLNLRPEINRFYMFSFLKNDIFKKQVETLCPKGATIKHAGERWMKCLIPYPKQTDSDNVIQLIEKIQKLIIYKEIEIRRKADGIYSFITDNLIHNQNSNKFVYNEPNIKEMLVEGRLDAAFYCKEYKEKIALIENYANGYSTPSELGFTIIPGPSLEIKLLKTRIDSDDPIDGFYQLLIPTNISEYGTVNKISYLGTARKLPLLEKGDILFGEAGFQKGRSVVIIDELKNCTTNAHGLYARRKDNDLSYSIYFRCIFDWYRRERLIDLMAVGGSGGHFSPEYFDYIKIPKFEKKDREYIVTQYHCEDELYKVHMSIDTLYSKYKEHDKKLGIFELDYEKRMLQSILSELHEKIILGESIEVDKVFIY